MDADTEVYWSTTHIMLNHAKGVNILNVTPKDRNQSSVCKETGNWQPWQCQAMLLTIIHTAVIHDRHPNKRATPSLHMRGMELIKRKCKSSPCMYVKESLFCSSLSCSELLEQRWRFLPGSLLLVKIWAVAREGGNDNLGTNRKCMTDVFNLSRACMTHCAYVWMLVCSMSLIRASSNWLNAARVPGASLLNCKAQDSSFQSAGTTCWKSTF